MINIKITRGKGAAWTAFILAAAMAFSVGGASGALAQENRYPDDNHDYDNRDDYNRNFYRRGGAWRRPFSNLPIARPGYSSQRIKSSPAYFGAKLRYLNDNWDAKYICWSPDGFNSQSMRPLVISLHGNDEDETDAFARWYYSLKQYNYAFVAPKWIAANKVMSPEELSELVDGIVLELKNREGMNVDSTKVILHGYERGASVAGYLSYYTPEKYVMVIVDSGPFPAIGSADDMVSSQSANSLFIPADELKKLAGKYIYLYSRHEDNPMYNKLEASRRTLEAAGVKAELNYTRDLLPGEFSESLDKSIVNMFDRAIGIK